MTEKRTPQQLRKLFELYVEQSDEYDRLDKIEQDLIVILDGLKTKCLNRRSSIRKELEDNGISVVKKS
jgi:hypothetical protein